MLNELHPEISVRFLFCPLEAAKRCYRGHRGVQTGIRELEEAFSEIQAEQTEIRDLGERVVAIGHHRGRGQGERRYNRIAAPLGSVEFKEWQGDLGPRVSRP